MPNIPFFKIRIFKACFKGPSSGPPFPKQAVYSERFRGDLNGTKKQRRSDGISVEKRERGEEGGGGGISFCYIFFCYMFRHGW
jgi:hypothetical protein